MKNSNSGKIEEYSKKNIKKYYCYIEILGSFDENIHNHIIKYTGTYDNYYANPSINYTYLLDVVETKTNETVLGFFEDKEKEVISYAGFPIICEVKDDYFEDVITGKKFKKNDYNFSNKDVPSELTFRISNPLSEANVATLLRKLTHLDAARYKTQMENLEKAYKEGYSEWERKDARKKLLELKPKQNDEEFIENFRKTYNK